MDSSTKPPAHPLAALFLIGGMSLAAAGVLHALGLTAGIDRGAAEWLRSLNLGGDFKDLPVVWTWAWTALVCCFGMAAGMLISRQHWRRAVIWTGVLVVTLAWAPVLGLSGWKTPLGMPLVATFWCGLCAMIYAARHQEPGEPEEEVLISD